MIPTYQIGQADLHMHSTASDGKPPVRELLNFVAKHRSHLNAIAITDHDIIDASLWAYERQHHYPFEVIPGIEVSSCDGHVLALWVTMPIPAGMNLPETVAAIHEAGGLAVLAHPFHLFMPTHWAAAWRHWQRPEVLLDSGIDAIETHNAAATGWGFNWLARTSASKLQLAVTSGSDAHTLGAIGTGITCFPGKTAADLRYALCQAQTIVKGSSWPTRDYVEYFKHERLRKAMTSSVNTSSSPLINN